MPVPLPIDLVMGALPIGFKGNLQEYANAIVDAITATVDGTFLTGQVGGNPPTSDIGPWANGNEWWFWDPVSGQYQPSNQGTPIGTIMIWGGTGQPTNWLQCDGSAVGRTVYSRLFQAVGETWGPGDGTSTFNLPPAGVFFVNAYGFSAAPGVPITSGYTGQGVNARGGGQTTTLIASMLPPLYAPFYGFPEQFNQSGATNLKSMVDSSATGATLGWKERIVDANNIQVGANQTGVPVMPPFCAANYVIKYQ